MKRQELIQIIEKNGAVLVRHGSKHDWYRNKETGVSESIPRHREIKNLLAAKIIKRLS